MHNTSGTQAPPNHFLTMKIQKLAQGDSQYETFPRVVPRDRYENLDTTSWDPNP